MPTPWRTNARRHRTPASAAAAVLCSATVSAPVVMEALGLAHYRDFHRAVEDGFVRLAKSNATNPLRVDVAFLLSQGLTFEALADAERRYAEKNHENYLRRKARQALKENGHD